MAVFYKEQKEQIILVEIANLQPQEPIIFQGMPSAHTLAYAASYPNHIYINAAEDDDLAIAANYQSAIKAIFLPSGSPIPQNTGNISIRYIVVIRNEVELEAFKPEDDKVYDLVLMDYDLINKVEQYSKEPLIYLEPGIAVARHHIYVHYLMKSSYNPFIV